MRWASLSELFTQPTFRAVLQAKCSQEAGEFQLLSIKAFRIRQEPGLLWETQGIDWANWWAGDSTERVNKKDISAKLEQIRCFSPTVSFFFYSSSFYPFNIAANFTVHTFGFYMTETTWRLSMQFGNI